MIVLDNYNDKIADFILATVQRFEKQKGIPDSVGIYCCPWSGWLTMNFNLRISIDETNNNCPDFEFAEFDILDFPEWQDEYEANEPQYKTGGKVFQSNPENGDEGINQIFFSYLLPIVTETVTKIKHKTLLQFLDSNCLKILESE